MLTIDHLLDDALLAKDHDVPADVVPYEDTAYPGSPADAPHPHPTRTAAEDSASLNLRTLCETVVNNQSEVAVLADFVTDQLPAPANARILGCVLHLARAEAGARFWWQYAAGAGDDTASYCLHLHHLSHGESHAAAWWRRQTGIGTRPHPTDASLRYTKVPARLESVSGTASTVDRSAPTLLRVIALLLADPDLRTPRSPFTHAVMDYVPSAVAAGYTGNPDVEIPLPGPHFADHLTALAAATLTAPPTRRTSDRAPTDDRPDLLRRPPREQPDEEPTVCARPAT